MQVTDEQAAATAISTLTELSPTQVEAASKINTILTSGDEDSFIDIHTLFSLFSTLYFRSLLHPQVQVVWSPRLTLCAGICELTKDTAGAYTRIRLKLSEPLLKFRPRSDVINTLLHESIHAYFFITSRFAHLRDPTGGHGAGFHALAEAVNRHGGYDVTEFHTFHAEVDSYRTHIWQCDGPCRARAPFFGLVKRAMNRPPGKGDTWWAQHQQECGGTYVKISEPEKTKKQVDAMSSMDRAGRQKNKIDAWVRKQPKLQLATTASESTPTPAGNGPSYTSTLKRSRSLNSEGRNESQSKLLLVSCPICDKSVAQTDINHHLDVEHPL
jgi:hypothetical protein